MPRPNRNAVSLQVSDLEEPQQETGAPGAAADSAHDRAVEDPAIDESGKRSEHALRRAISQV